MKVYTNAIKTELVTDVLLSDGWHRVGRILPDIPDSSLSFTLSHFLFDDEENGRSQPVAGFWFLDGKTGLELHGPLASILSVKVKGLHSQRETWRDWLQRQVHTRRRQFTVRPAES